MRHSPCRAHYQQTLAAFAPAEDMAHNAQHANAYELMLVKLAEDKRRLHDIKGTERKAEIKAQLLPEYQPWIAGTLEADTGRQDDVLMTVFVWTIDIGDFTKALEIGAYAIRHKMTMPDQYKRDVPTVLAEEIADAALKADEAGRAAMLASLLHARVITADLDMHDQVRAKLNKAIGYAQRAAGHLEPARETLARALELDQRSGVKKDIERIDVLIKNSPATVDAEKAPKTEAG